MAKRKLARFEEMKSFPNVVQPGADTALAGNFHLMGKWKNTFFKNSNPLVLELGCGKGEYTTNLARKYPEKNFLGIDVKGARIWRGAKTCVDENILNAGFLRIRIDWILSFFGQDEVDEIWLTFPDPQAGQKKRIRKRLSSPMFLNRYKKFLKPDGIVHLKTDSDLLYQYTKQVAQVNNLQVLTDIPDVYGMNLNNDVLSIPTHYEQIFRNQGYTIKYFSFKLNTHGEIIEPETD